MVSVVQLHPQGGAAAIEPLARGLSDAERVLLVRALEFAEPLYAGHALSTGEPVWPHALGLAGSLAGIGVDPVARAAGVLFAAPKYLERAEVLGEAFGAEIAALAAGVERLYQLRVLTRTTAAQQSEALRKMVLGMVEDVRVVLIRLAEPHADAALVRQARRRRARAPTRARRSTSTRRSPTGWASGS